MGRNPTDLIAIDSKTAVITLRNKVTMEQYKILGGKYQGTILSIDGKKSTYFFSFSWNLCIQLYHIYMEFVYTLHSETKILIIVF